MIRMRMSSQPSEDITITADLPAVESSFSPNRTLMDEFPRQNRGGKGVKCYRITDKTGNVIGAKAVNIDNDVMLITTEGVIIRTSCEEISAMKRITSGVKVMNVGKDVSVASIAKVREKDPRENNSPDNEENTAEIEDSTDDQND